MCCFCLSSSVFWLVRDDSLLKIERNNYNILILLNSKHSGDQTLNLFVKKQLQSNPKTLQIKAEMKRVQEVLAEKF